MEKEIIFPWGENKNETEGLIIKIPVTDIKPLSRPLRDSAKQLKSVIKILERNGGSAPICVLKKESGKYELLAGRQRLAAAVIAGMTEVNAVLCVPDNELETVLTLLRGSDGIFNCFEEADFFKKVIGSGEYTQRELAERIGKSQSYISNKMRLCRFSPYVRRKIIESGLSERHARQFLRISDEKLMRYAVNQAAGMNMNVEKTEEMVDDLLGKTKKDAAAKKKVNNTKPGGRTMNKAAENINENTRAFDEAESRSDKSELLRQLIKEIMENIDAAKALGLTVNAGQRNTDRDVEIVIRVPRAENSVSLKSTLKPAEGQRPPSRDKNAA
ncbi:MAG: ParB/RepB/Spo0J family partition protein [Clostridia bacterium]|nr:ParB/RepB/Spo0J family partition protein [Clostridia bacterium]